MVQDLFARLAEFTAGLDPWQQVLFLIPAGAIPFIESYLGSFLGTVTGVHPAFAIPAAVLGNLVATFAVVLLASRTREAVTADRGEPRQRPVSKRREKVARIMDRFGVPGVCLLGPIVVASQITGPILVGLGASKRGVLVWMTVSIVVWGVLFGAFGSALGALLV